MNLVEAGAVLPAAGSNLPAVPAQPRLRRLSALLLLFLHLLLTGCSSQPQGEKLTPAPGMQIIGDPEDGGGIAQAVSDLMQITGLKRNRDDESAPARQPMIMVPMVKDFGELAPGVNWEPENAHKALSESEVTAHLEKARLWRFGAFRLYIWHGGDFAEAGEGVALYHHHTLAYARKGRFYVTNPAKREDDQDYYTLKGPAPGADIDGDGRPDLLLYEHSGGQHCCWTVLHTECGPRPLVRAEFHTWHHEPRFEDLDGDGRAEVWLLDSSYAYWHECYADSPKPPVVLRIRNGRYAMAGDLMRSQAPSTDTLAEATAKIKDWISHYHRILAGVQRGGQPPRNDKIWNDQPLEMWSNSKVCIPSTVWGVMLDLIYCGRCQEALAFVDAIRRHAYIIVIFTCDCPGGQGELKGASVRKRFRPPWIRGEDTPGPWRPAVLILCNRSPCSVREPLFSS